jgi:sn-glycerol 3-phosphate transport system substrate-binding protein
MSGDVGKAAQQLVDEFNAQHKDIVVQAEFQGKYDESLNKLKASLGSDNGPSLIQVYEIGSRFMIDSKAITPMQQFIDADHYDTSSLEPNILNYYTFDGKLYSMPFNTSNPILYYNKDAFKAAGLDPEKAPATYEEVADAAKKLTKSGQAGSSFAIYGWFMEQLFAGQGAELINNGNGRTQPATSSLLGSDAGVKTLDWWKSMVDDKTMLNLGRKTDDTSKAFAAGQIAMTLDSTASLRSIVKAAEGKFEVGTGFLPKPDANDKGGVIVGGASNWILNNRPEAEQKAAWEFIKFLAEPKSQAEWHINTGYFTITQKAYDEQIVKDNMAKYPQFQTAVEQLHQTVPSLATQGAVMGVFPEARQLTETAIEEVLNGKKTSKQALDDAAKAITSKIEEYNKTVSK